MKISELTRLTGVTVATIKYYVREGLMPAGVASIPTQAEYDQGHVDRLRLIRALVEVGGLSLGTVRELLQALDAPGPGDEATAVAVTAAHRARSAGSVPTGPPHQARAVVESLGWSVAPDSAALDQLQAALVGLDLVVLPPSARTLQVYADAALGVAEADLRGGPPVGSADGDLRSVVIGTVMYEPVLLALRRLAQQHVVRAGGPASGGPT